MFVRVRVGVRVWMEDQGTRAVKVMSRGRARASDLVLADIRQHILKNLLLCLPMMLISGRFRIQLLRDSRKVS